MRIRKRIMVIKQKKARFKRENILVTCALPYVNNVPHIGNIAGSHLPGDIFSRFCKLRGHNCIYIGGSDEHGTPSVVAAQELGITPKDLCDVLYKEHKRIYDWLLIDYDNFSRTSRKIHHKTTIDFFKKIYDKGFVSKMAVNLPYCPKCERTLPDRYIGGTCPKCGYDRARGDQCEKCTTLLEPRDLLEPKCVVCGTEPEFRTFDHLFLRLDSLEPKIKKWITDQKHWRPTVKTLALGWIKEGLKARAITRDLDWGIKVPLKGFEDKVFYVWFDAPIGYISSTKEWAKRNKKNWETFWKGGSKMIHFIGKDNIPFHTVWWGGMLIANGEFNLPYSVAGLQFLNYEGDKISKSKKWGIFCENLPKSGLDPDVWRYYLAEVMPESKDSEWKWEEFKNKVNGELVGNLGNFINRTVSFISNYFGGKIPDAGKLNQKDERALKNDYDKIWELAWKTNLRDALKEIMKISSKGNKYFQENEPWKLIKTDKKRCSTVMNVCANLCKDLGVIIWPFLPGASGKLSNVFGNKIIWGELGKLLKHGTKIKSCKPLFPKLDDKQIKEIKNIVTDITPLENYFGKKGGDMVSFEEFKRIKLKIGTIKSAEPVAGADKLFKMKVDIGEEITIVSGIKDWYNEKDLVGRQIVVVTNLEPAVIKGIKSEGMLLAAEDKKGDVVLLQPDKKIEKGSKVL
jgi:methionyl-tRNA synthetase